MSSPPSAGGRDFSPSAPAVPTPQPILTAKRSSKPALRSAAYLVIATLGLVAFILGLGDLRRQRNAVAQAKWHAGVFQARVGEGKALPLNLAPETPPEGAAQMIRLESLPHDAAMNLRGTTQPIIAAWTAPVLQVLRRDGRAVLLFHEGRFEVRWMTLRRFEELRARQTAARIAP